MFVFYKTIFTILYDMNCMQVYICKYKVDSVSRDITVSIALSGSLQLIT